MRLSVARKATKRLDDGALVRRAQDGNRGAFSELVRRHQHAVYRFCYRVLGEREDAKDASQEAFIRAYKRLGTFRGRSEFGTWMLRVATNVSLNERARRKTPPADAGLIEALPDPEVPEDELLKAEVVTTVHEALRLVGSEERAAVVLHDLEGLTYGETAEFLGIPEGTAKTWVRRGRQRLKELLT